MDPSMVSARMAAVLAVALLLFCGNVQSAEEGAAAYATQVKTSLTTAPAVAPAMAPAATSTTEGSDIPNSAVLIAAEQGPSSALAMAPAITTTTEGSDTIHSAVLSAVEQGQDANLVLVDLAWVDNEKLINVASAPEPSPSASSIPDGFDMVEAEAPAQSSTEVEALEPTAAGPDSTPMDEGTSLAADSFSEGHLVSGDFPRIQDTDHSGGAGYGVRGGGADGQSFAGIDQTTSLAADSSSEGHLVSGDFPRIQDTDHSGGAGYGVRGGGADGQSFAAMGKDSASVVLEDEARPGSNAFETTGVTFGKSHTYLPASTSKATWGKGNCTFYGGMDAAGTMSGACGYGNLYASGYGAYSAALSSALFKNGVACGACYEVACSGSKSCKPGSVLVTVTNFCPPNPGRSADNGGWCNGANEHFDLSYPAFARIADPKAGVVALNYRRVPCKKQGGIRFTLNGNCNLNLVTITNVGGSGVVIEVYMKGDKMDWAPMSRNWGANWQCSRNYCGKGISIKIVTSDGKVSVNRLAGPEWAFGKTYIGQQVY